MLLKLSIYWQISDPNQLDQLVTVIEDKWVNVSLEEKRLKAKTLLNYMFSLDKFLIFLESRDMGPFPKQHAAIRNWRKAMKKAVAVDNKLASYKAERQIWFNKLSTILSSFKVY